MSRVIAGVLAVIGVVLAGCSAPQAPAENNADSFFAQRMILHRNQVVEAAKLVEGRTKTPVVLALAKRFQEDPPAEIAQLTEWVKKWGEVPHVSVASIPGAIKPADLARLRDATDQKFDSAWLDMMTVHHLGAITMAETELRQGVRAEARALARQVIDTRQPQLDVMQGMNGG